MFDTSAQQSQPTAEDTPANIKVSDTLGKPNQPPIEDPNVATELSNTSVQTN